MSAQTQTDIRIKRHDIAITEGLEGFDPRRIVSLRSSNKKTIEVIVLDSEKIVPLAQKVTLSIPEMDQKYSSGVTEIRSIQLLAKDGKEMIIAEIAGMIEVAGKADGQVILWIQAVAKAMKKYNVTSAFFPVHTSSEASSFVYGEQGNAKSFRPIFGVPIQNLRVLEDGENLVFSTGNEIRTIHMSNATEKFWGKFSKMLYSGSKKIGFIGRFQSNKTHITFDSGEVCVFKLGPHSLQKLEKMPTSGITAFLGLIDKGISAAIGTNKDSKESVLTLIPQSMMPSAA